MSVQSKVSIKKNNVLISKGKIVSELKKATSTDTCHISPVLFFLRSKANSTMSTSSWVPLEKKIRENRSLHIEYAILLLESKKKKAAVQCFSAW
jgi:hypothetical protein